MSLFSAEDRLLVGLDQPNRLSDITLGAANISRLTLESPLPVQRVGMLGRAAPKFISRVTDLFGDGNWELGYKVGNSFVSRDAALELYGRSYLEFLRNSPELLDRLLSTASSVYDNDPADVNCGLSWDDPHAKRTHIQDIAVRRAVVALGQEFRGDKLVQVKSNGDFPELSPGNVPFVYPDIILTERVCVKRWIQPGSVEDFWQNNKFLLVQDDPAIPSLLRAEALAKALGEDASDRYTIRKAAHYLVLCGQFDQEFAEVFCDYFDSIKHGDTIQGWVFNTLDAFSAHNQSLSIPETETLLAMGQLRPLFDRLAYDEAFSLAVASYGCAPVVKAAFYCNMFGSEFLSDVYSSNMVARLIDDTELHDVLASPAFQDFLFERLGKLGPLQHLFDRFNNARFDEVAFESFTGNVLGPLLRRLDPQITSNVVGPYSDIATRHCT